MSGFAIAVTAVMVILSFLAGWFSRQNLGKNKIAKAAQLADKLLAEAKAESENYQKEKLLEAKEEIFQLRQNFEKASKDKHAEFQKLEKQLTSRDVNLDRKVDILNKKEHDLKQRDHDVRVKTEMLAKQERELETLLQEESSRLERISGLTSEEAKRIQMENILEKAKQEIAQEIREMTEQAKREASEDATEIVLQALQRSSIAHIVDTTVSIIKLPDDEMKGRIIGREGRNIRAFEAATGIEVLIDDTPQTVVLSGFDPIRREVARLSMENLIYDGRIHPGRIEELVEKTRVEIEEKIFETGGQTVHDLGLPSMHNELVRLLGKQQFRTTYGQNLLQHSKEVAILAGGMAAQLGLDSTLAKRAGLLHDIGKTAEEYGDAPFHQVGSDLAKKFGENERVQNAILCQAPDSSDVEVRSPISILVKMADSISVSRPGAQKEMLETYIKRMSNLEEIAMSFTGVLTAYAIQAGREVRVMVEHTVVDDTRAQVLANNITQKFKQEMEFPGQIKVTVIREYRSVDYAK